MKDRSAIVVEAVRSPIGKIGGALASVRADDLAAHAIRALIQRCPSISPEIIEDVYLGCANQAGEDNRNVARMGLLLAGLPQSVPGCTVNRLCASGLEAINCAARAILSGEGEVFIAGGVENMSRAPWAIPKAEAAYSFGNLTAYDTALGWRFPNPKMKELFPLLSMGETAENVAEKYKISREDQDAFAFESHQRATAARNSVFKEEIAPVIVLNKKGSVEVSQDEGPRSDTSLEKLSLLKAAFRPGGTVTAGNSSSLNDGSAAILMMEAHRASEMGLRPFARWLGSATVGVDPSYMGIAPIFAIQKLLKRAKMQITDIGLFEINEAFAAQTLACQRELGIDLKRLNVNGGAIALGHPLGCSGARLAVTLLHEMRRRKEKFGITALCVGVGQGLATLWELAN
jgi:3-oxoadipyl-CoA thiolase